MSASEKELTIRICGKVDNSLNTVSDKVDKAFHKLTSAAKTLGIMGGTAVAGAVTAAVDVGKEYEAQMSTVQAISGATAAEYEQLNAKAQEMGKATQFSAAESAQAMEYMAMAGWKTDDMLGGIEGIMDLAAASGESLSSVSDIVTDALTAFNMTAEDSGHFADVLAKASSNSNTNVSMMGETFKYVASVAGSLGYSAEDTAVSVGLLANSGIKASQSGTIMRKLMSETAGGIQLVSKAYAKHGEKTGKLMIETANADGSMKDWSETVGRLREEFGKMTEEEKAANAESIGGKTAMSGLLAIVNASEKDYKKLTEQINNASGATKEMAEIRLDNLEGDIKLFQSALEGKGIELYDELKEPLRDLAQDATEWLNEIDVGRVVDDFRDFGEAVLDFAEPFLNVGEWMLDNPEVMAGTLAGIGGAITTYKLADTLPKVGGGIVTLGKSLAANPWLAGGALAAGAIAGIGTAVSMTQRKLANASLEDHFGDISLSMKDIKDTAEDIIGADTFHNLGKMFDSVEVSEKFSEEMEDALNAIDEVKWKISAGIELDQDDMDSFEKNTKEYVKTAQDLIDKKGYTVNVATKVLFGDSAKGKELIKEDNSIFAAMEMEADGLAKRINSTLEEAMTKGLTPDLQKVLDGYMDEMAKLTEAEATAESNARWDTLKMDFSGKELDADSWERLQEKINEAVEEDEKGAEEARYTVTKNAELQNGMGYISEEELEQKKDFYQKQYEEKVRDAKNKASEFYYNTLMDTYGKEIAAGDFGAGDKDAIGKIVSKMGELEPEGGYGTVSDVLNKAFNGGGDVAAVDDAAGMTKQKEYQLMTKELANDFILNGEGLDTEAEKVGNETAEALRTSFSQELSRGIQADTKIQISGTYDASFAGNPYDANVINRDPYAGRGISSYANKSSPDKNGGASSSKGGKVSLPSVPGYAVGTISNKQHMAMVSEGNKTEAIIPIDGSERSRRLYEATGKLMGNPSTPPVTFAPHIEVHVSGGATKEDGKKIGDEVQKVLEKSFRKMVRDHMRFSMRH